MSVKPPTTRKVSIWKIQDMLQDDIIKLDAAYQRDIVWPTGKMSMLIDSIMNKYYVPPLLFAVRTDEKGKQIRVCIDGKQRLTSIHRFMKNEIPFLDETTGITEEVYYEAPDNNSPTDGNKGMLYQRYLTEDARELFDDTDLIMIEYTDLDEDQELEIFARVQMGVTITAAEKLVATNSEASKFTRDMLNEFKNLSKSIKEIQGIPFKWMAQLIFVLHEQDDKFVATQAKLMHFLKDRTLILDDTFKRKAKRTIKLIDSLFKREDGKHAVSFKNPILNTKRREHLRNIEFLVFGSYVHDLNHSTTLSKLATDLTALRMFFMTDYHRSLCTGNPSWTAGMLWKRSLIKEMRRTEPAAALEEQSSAAPTTAEEEAAAAAPTPPPTPTPPTPPPKTSKTRTKTATASKATNRRQGVSADTESSSSDENDVDSEESDVDPRRRQQKKRRQQGPVETSKRRREKRNEHVELKREEYQLAESSSAPQGHVNELGRPLARRGGKKSFGAGRRP